MSNAVAAINTLLKRGDGASPEVFTTVAEVTDINGPTLSATVVDVTSHSTNNPWKEKMTTLLDGGTLSTTLNFIPTDATHNGSAGVLADFTGRVKRNWKLVFPDQPATTYAFTAYVSKFSIAAKVADRLTAAVDLEITDEPTFS